VTSETVAQELALCSDPAHGGFFRLAVKRATLVCAPVTDELRIGRQVDRRADRREPAADDDREKWQNKSGLESQTELK
jgi:hypothetical protein